MRNLILLIILFATLLGCKHDASWNLPKVLHLAQLTTNDITQITNTTAITGGIVTKEGADKVTNKGACYATTPHPTIQNTVIRSGVGAGTFTVNLNGLIPNTKYYLRAYATNIDGTAYGNEICFTTTNIFAGLPTLTTTAVTKITNTTAASGGNITNDSGSAVIARGVCYSTSNNPTTKDSLITSGTGLGNFISNLSRLLPNTTYYVRAYATNGIGTAYGNQGSFATTQVIAKLPLLTTNSTSTITSTTAISGGNVITDSGFAVIARGVCYNTIPLPTTSNNTVASGTGTGSFTSNLTLLSPATTYYVRTYATNAAGTAYGNQVNFTTLANLPTLTTDSVAPINSLSAICRWNISNDGGSAIILSGVCYSTNAHPTILDSCRDGGSGTGTFVTGMSGLLPNITYYVRAYARNSVGTAYGNVLNFTTPSLSIGQNYEGGIIAYILQPGDPGYNSSVQHGLIAAPSDQSTGIVWWNGSYVTTGATGTAIGAGLANTNAIIAAQGAGSYAAMLCHNLTLDGYTDWYLPSEDELYELFINKSYMSGFSAYYYWSSSEGSSGGAWFQWFYDGERYNSSHYGEGNPYYVRAVRSF